METRFGALMVPEIMNEEGTLYHIWYMSTDNSWCLSQHQDFEGEKILSFRAKTWDEAKAHYEHVMKVLRG